MATNIKHYNNCKYQKALTEKDRVNLDKIISSHRAMDGSLSIKLNDIANMLEKDPTTLSKEVKNRRTPLNTSTPKNPYILQWCKFCSKYAKCEYKKDAKSIPAPCIHFQKALCKHITRFPWVCNGCHKKGVCQFPKSVRVQYSC